MTRIRRVSWSTAFVGVATLLVGSCGTTDLCACSDPVWVGAVHGTVSEPGGAGVTGATVKGFAVCPGQAFPLPEAQTGASGTYEVGVFGPPRPDTVCVRLVASPPSSRPDLAPSDTVLARVPLGLTIDSVRADLTLKAR